METLKAFFIVFLVLSGKVDSLSKKKCPDHCQCSNDYQTVKCVMKGLTSVPSDIPEEVTTLDLTSNKITSLPMRSFFRLGRLTNLLLGRNKINSIEDSAFEGLEKLTTLRLDYNKLTSFKKSVLDDLKQLEVLYLTKNLLTSVPPFASVPLSKLKTLYLNNNNLSSADFCGDVSTPRLAQLQRIVLSTNPINTIRTGDFKCLNGSRVDKLNINRCHLNTVQQDALSFEALKSLSISYNPDLKWDSLKRVFVSVAKSHFTISLDLCGSLGVAQLNNESFVELGSSVKELRICDSKRLRSIEENTFVKFTKLEKLDIHNTNLAYIRDSLINCKELFQMDLSNNKILDQNSLKQLNVSSLEKLNLNGCKFIVLEGGVFANKRKLQKITLKSCAIQSIQKDSFANLTDLQELDLSFNNLGGMLPKFGNIINLKRFYLNNNKISSLINNYRTFHNLTQLQILGLNDNSCSDISDIAFIHLAKLQILNLAGNNLSSYMANAKKRLNLFTNLTSLTTLKLDRNQINHIADGIFNKLENIQSIDISDNNINSLIKVKLSKLPRLQLISLASNKISVLYPDDSDLILSENVSIDLSSNPFDCFCSLRRFKLWIQSQNESVVFKKFPGIQGYLCSSPESIKNQPLLSFKPDLIWAQCNILAMSITAIVIFVLLIVVVVVVYLFRWNLRLQYYLCKKRCSGRNRRNAFYRRQRNYQTIPQDEDSNDLDYDVAICHSRTKRDEDWVMNVLLPRVDYSDERHQPDDQVHRIDIEAADDEPGIQDDGNNDNADLIDQTISRPPFDLGRVFAPNRDVLAGKDWVHSTYEAVDRAHLVIICLSNYSLEDKWLQSLSSLALLSHTEKDLSQVLLLFLDDDVSVKVDTCLRNFVKDGLHWSWEEGSAKQKTFWEQLDDVLRDIAAKWYPRVK